MQGKLDATQPVYFPGNSNTGKNRSTKDFMELSSYDAQKSHLWIRKGREEEYIYG